MLLNFIDRFIIMAAAKHRALALGRPAHGAPAGTWLLAVIDDNYYAINPIAGG